CSTDRDGSWSGSLDVW
nr:immunoglobulin heavy chain junction region [Macaca mulatta]MOW46226.1 immunoglobulin heavy chain junction region [Macaca mulatta]MOW47308.1 immunoglobulin heavy chain junction region [Macaca mulatta]MOW48335.1 immunoglobulin heavy chain junction region [Macaca mulatta]MOW48542.1 immunoglobulin heavy chain junction region [Macaca mulatta]